MSVTTTASTATPIRWRNSVRVWPDGGDRKVDGVAPTEPTPDRLRRRRAPGGVPPRARTHGGSFRGAHELSGVERRTETTQTTRPWQMSLRATKRMVIFWQSGV